MESQKSICPAGTSPPSGNIPSVRGGGDHLRFHCFFCSNKLFDELVVLREHTEHDTRALALSRQTRRAMGTSPPNVRLRSYSGDADSLDDAEFEESRTPRTRPLGRRADDNGGATSIGRQPGSSPFMSATSAAFTRVKGMTIRSGSSGRVLNPRSVTLVSSLFSPSRERRGGIHAEKNTEKRYGSNRPLSQESNSNNSDADSKGEASGTRSFEETEQDGTGGKSNKLSVIFDDDESGTENRSEGGSASTNADATTPRSKWASTLMAATLVREKTTGKTAVRGRVDLLPRPRDAGNKVLRMV